MDLEHALEIAATAHRGQTNKAGEPFILHPLRVMLACSGPDERIVAVLHDVVEKSDWTLDALREEGLEEQLVAAVDAMTRRENETYSGFVDRAAAHPISRPVKIADLRDNLAMTQSEKASQEDRKKAEKYVDALTRLGCAPDEPLFPLGARPSSDATEPQVATGFMEA